MVGTWLGEIRSCSCLAVLPDTAWVLLNKIYQPFFTSLYWNLHRVRRFNWLVRVFHLKGVPERTDTYYATGTVLKSIFIVPDRGITGILRPRPSSPLLPNEHAEEDGTTCAERRRRRRRRGERWFGFGWLAGFGLGQGTSFPCSTRRSPLSADTSARPNLGYKR